MGDFLPWRGSMKSYWFQFWKWKLWHSINSPLSWLELWCWDWTPQHDICLLMMYSSQRWEVREVLVVAVSLTRERGEMWIFHKINVGCIDICQPLGNWNVFVTIHTFLPSCLHKHTTEVALKPKQTVEAMKASEDFFFSNFCYAYLYDACIQYLDCVSQRSHCKCHTLSCRTYSSVNSMWEKTDGTV